MRMQVPIGQSVGRRVEGVGLYNDALILTFDDGTFSAVGFEEPEEILELKDFPVTLDERWHFSFVEMLGELGILTEAEEILARFGRRTEDTRARVEAD